MCENYSCANVSDYRQNVTEAYMNEQWAVKGIQEVCVCVCVCVCVIVEEESFIARAETIERCDTQKMETVEANDVHEKEWKKRDDNSAERGNE